MVNTEGRKEIRVNFAIFTLRLRLNLFFFEIGNLQILIETHASSMFDFRHPQTVTTRRFFCNRKYIFAWNLWL